MKYVLGVVGSPRWDGNTHILVEQILKGAREAGAKADAPRCIMAERGPMV
ncbi:MAG TPA: hypothetical protein VLM89_08290 [Phycisphaerae bacterium]|nr:hypothetical protein [Phycisphaerae bacterium]